MSKRTLSPASLPPAKRLRAPGNTKHRIPDILSFEGSLYDELILCIFSYLSWTDLCTTQSTSKTWARLAADNELWRKQYLLTYGRTRLRGAKGFIARLDGREVRPLPGRAAKPDQYKDWKWMFRISSNWRKGRSVVEESLDLTHHFAPTRTTLRPSLPEKTHILLAGALIISATSLPSNQPTITITKEKNEQHTISIPFSEDLSRAPSIAALALDQSPPSVPGNLTLACFLHTGEFTVFEFKHTSPSNVVQKYVYKPSRTAFRIQNVIHAVYYHPLVATLSSNFSLCLYDVSSTLGTVRHTQTLSSFTSYPPASLVLSSISPMVFKLVVAYSIPVYPRHWSIGATELIISQNVDSSAAAPSGSSTFSSASFREDYKYPLPSTISVISSRTIRAFDVPTGWVDDASLRAMREQWGRKLISIADAQTDGKWVILAPGQSNSFDDEERYMNAHALGESPSSSVFSYSMSGSTSSKLHSPTNLQLYRLVLPNHSPSISASPPKLTFIRTLHGQTSPVSSLALADGRCVSLGCNGSIWVWDLEGGTGAEVTPADDTLAEHMGLVSLGTVTFDERRIISAHAGKVVARRFDV